MKYFIKEDYYFDIDKHNQLRITGPENHLLLGLALGESKVTVGRQRIKDGQLEISLALSGRSLEAPLPLVTDIRTLRSYTEGHNKQVTFSELGGIEELAAEKIERNDEHTLTFTSSYTDDKGQENEYGATLIFPKNAGVRLGKTELSVVAKKEIKFKIRTVNKVSTPEKIAFNVFRPDTVLPDYLFSPFITSLYEEAGRQIVFLVRSKKTSSFEYGTIFPRDWIESADLGVGDLSEEMVDHMYAQSMKFISEAGEGWHEDIVGHYKSRTAQKHPEVAPVDRKMIDIEPHYILGMERLSKNFLAISQNQEMLQRVARYILAKAQELDLITFKKISEENEDYYPIGNWRDSSFAFPRARSPIAPYDVNCVFYPESLRVIKKFAPFFKLNEDELQNLDKLLEKWGKNKNKFKLYHDEGLVGYSLALHGKKHIPLAIPHLDESYDLFYSMPSMEEVVSFAKKIMDPDYFYTPVGPILVSRDEEDLNSENYHGKVIWPKQAAFAVAGLYKHYLLGSGAGWPENIQDLVRGAILTTCRACFKGWLDLGAVPELYYYDENLDKARFYTDQEEHEGQMSLIQLWSSVGMRTITKVYVNMMS